MAARPDASCAHCAAPFSPVKAWQRFCSKSCRSAFHDAEDGGLRGVVASVRVMKRGAISVTVRFGIEDRDAALGIEPGKVIEVVQ